MNLVRKTLKESGRSVFIYYPQGKPRELLKRSAITVLREDGSEASVLRLLFDGGLAKLAEEYSAIVAFPNPAGAGWNSSLDPSRPSDVEFLDALHEEIKMPEPMPKLEHPKEMQSASDSQAFSKLFEEFIAKMQNSWHLMHDCRYFIGFGSGASMLFTMAAVKPNNIAAILAFGGGLDRAAEKNACGAPMPAHLIGSSDAAVQYLIRANGAEPAEKDGIRSVYRSKINPLQSVTVDGSGSKELSPALLDSVWNGLFERVRRPNTSPFGDIDAKIPFKEYPKKFEYFETDRRLGDNNRMPHTWITHVPDRVKKNPDQKVPLMVVAHGGSDNPCETADCIRFHELGERDGFITVYPWSCTLSSWNTDMGEKGLDDIAYLAELIRYMIRTYPVDAGRVYASGFSNGAGVAHALGMAHPELVTAVCPIDANWPGYRDAPSDVDPNAVHPFALAMARKHERDYRVPVWYTYGSREPAYPIYKKSTQQYQYDMWKTINNITVKPTPERSNPDPSGCGVPGDRYERLTPSAIHPHHAYDVQRFYTNDTAPKNYYNYVIMLGKGHDIAHMDAALGWEYVKHFRRNPDGSLEEI